MDDDPTVDEEGEDALYEYLFGYEATAASDEETSRGLLLPP